jgi:hypothetical protein
MTAKKGVSEVVMIIIGVVLTILILVLIYPLIKKAFQIVAGGV